jgi:hypothetical protein
MVNTCNIVLIPYWFAIATLIFSLLIDFVLANLYVLKKAVERWKCCATCMGKFSDKNTSVVESTEENGTFEFDKNKHTSHLTYLLRAKVVITCIIDIGYYIYTIYSWTDIPPNSYHPSSHWGTYQCLGIALTNGRIWTSYQANTLAFIIKQKQNDKHE